jgi:hypothetical protein
VVPKAAGARPADEDGRGFIHLLCPNRITLFVLL